MPHQIHLLSPKKHVKLIHPLLFMMIIIIFANHRVKHIIGNHIILFRIGRSVNLVLQTALLVPHQKVMVAQIVKLDIIDLMDHAH